MLKDEEMVKEIVLRMSEDELAMLKALLRSVNVMIAEAGIEPDRYFTDRELVFMMGFIEDLN